MELYGTKQIAEKLNLAVHTIRAYITREHFPVVVKFNRTYITKETLENLLYMRSRGMPISRYVEMLDKPHKDGFDPDGMSLRDYQAKGWTPRYRREHSYNQRHSSGMGDSSQTDLFEESKYVRPKYLQLWGEKNDFGLEPVMYLKEKEDMTIEELREYIDETKNELEHCEKVLRTKDKGYTGNTIQVDKSGTSALINELQKTIADQEREIYKLDKRITEATRRMELLKKSK